MTSASLVGAPPDRDWLDVGSAAVVEVTSEDGAHPVESAQLQEIVRQQWNFSPPETERETEDYAVDPSDVTALELNSVPDKSGGEVRASLECLRLG